MFEDDYMNLEELEIENQDLSQLAKSVTKVTKEVVKVNCQAESIKPQESIAFKNEGGKNGRK